MLLSVPLVVLHNDGVSL